MFPAGFEGSYYQVCARTLEAFVDTAAKRGVSAALEHRPCLVIPGAHHTQMMPPQVKITATTGCSVPCHCVSFAQPFSAALLTAMFADVSSGPWILPEIKCTRQESSAPCFQAHPSLRGHEIRAQCKAGQGLAAHVGLHARVSGCALPSPLVQWDSLSLQHIRTVPFTGVESIGAAPGSPSGLPY